MPQEQFSRKTPQTQHIKRRHDDMANETKITRVITRKIRLSYVNIDKPKSINGSDPIHSLCALISKDDKETIADIKAAMKAAEKLGIEKYGIKFPTGSYLLPLHDGDVKHPDQKEYENCYYINAKNTKFKPGIVDKNGNTILDSSEIYSGCYARVILDFFPFNHSMNKGISCSLEGIQKIADGESLGGGRTRAEDVFDVWEDDDDDFLS
jgi:hypothetical protein